MDVTESGAIVLERSADGTGPGVAETVADLLQAIERADITSAQQHYLTARIASRGPGEAARVAGVKWDTVCRTWRAKSPTFEELEQRAAALSNDAAVIMARAIAQRAAPSVVLRQVEQASESHSNLSDRQLMAQQRARDSVLKAAGLDRSESAGDGLVMDDIAVAVFARLRRQA
jgi:hypothetical protein